MTAENLPIDRIEVITVRGKERHLTILDGSLITGEIYHNVNDATLTIDFANVETVKVVYKHNLGGQ